MSKESLLGFVDDTRCRCCGNLIKPSNLNNNGLCNRCDYYKGVYP